MKKKLNTKKFRYGVNATVLSCFFIAVIILINILAGVLIDRFPSLNIDLSENGQFKISNATREVLKNIDKSINFTVVLANQTKDEFVDEILQRYKEINRKINIKNIDAYKNPTALSKYNNINPMGTLIVECGEKYKPIDFDDLYGQKGRMEDAESYITNAIVFVTSEQEKNILMTEGHNEKNFATLKTLAERKYFNVKTINLSKDAIENCDILAICAPDLDFTPQELSSIQSYVNDGGNIQLYFNPTAGYLPNLFEYVKEWGIEVKNETVKENNPDNIYTANSGYLPLISENDYTKNINNQILYDSSFREDILFSDTKGVTVTPVLTTTEDATTLLNGVDTNAKGKYNIALLSVKSLENDKQAKLFVSGGTLLLTTEYENQFVGNESVASNMMQNMLSSKDYVEIETKKSSAEAFRMNIGQVYFVLIALALLAIGVLVVSIIVWRKRRYL